MDNDDDMTTLRCSRCQTIVVTVPVDLTVESNQLSAYLVRDLLRATALHCYSCPRRDT